MRIYWALLGWARGRTNRNGMRTTLERIKAEVEAAPTDQVVRRVAMRSSTTGPRPHDPGHPAQDLGGV